MKKHNHQRDLTFAVYGALAGIVVTVVSAAAPYELVGALSGGVLRDPRTGFNDVLPRADVLRRTRSNFITAPASSASSSASSVPVAESAPQRDCVIARAIAGAFLQAIVQYVPVSVENTGMIEGLRAPANRALDTYCVPVPVASSSSSLSSVSNVRRVNNNCDAYGKTSDRYATCKAKEEMGIRY